VEVDLKGIDAAAHLTTLEGGGGAGTWFQPAARNLARQVPSFAHGSDPSLHEQAPLEQPPVSSNVEGAVEESKDDTDVDPLVLQEREQDDACSPCLGSRGIPDFVPDSCVRPVAPPGGSAYKLVLDDVKPAAPLTLAGRHQRLKEAQEKSRIAAATRQGGKKPSVGPGSAPAIKKAPAVADSRLDNTAIAGKGIKAASVKYAKPSRAADPSSKPTRPELDPTGLSFPTAECGGGQMASSHHLQPAGDTVAAPAERAVTMTRRSLAAQLEVAAPLPVAEAPAPLVPAGAGGLLAVTESAAPDNAITHEALERGQSIHPTASAKATGRDLARARSAHAGGGEVWLLRSNPLASCILLNQTDMVVVHK